MNLEKFQYTSSKGLSIVLEKHEGGGHDQSTHGSWARGESFKMVSSLIDKLSQIDTPGFSINIISKKKPRSGYMVSDFEKEKPIPSKDFFSSRSASKGYIKDYIKENAQELSEKGAYLGGWVYKGKVYLDVSRRYASKKDAVYALFDNKQISGYNVEQDSYFYRKDEVDDRANKASNGGSNQASQSDDRGGTGLLRGGSSPSNRGQSLTYSHICLGRYSVLAVEKHLEGQHDQTTHGNWAGDRYPTDSVKSARDGAKEYAFKKGLKPDESIDYTKVVANRERASKIADLYESLPKMDRDAVDEYEALASEVEEQFNYMTKTLGVKVEFVAEDPYKTSKEMFADVSTGSLKVLSTATTGAHPIFSDEQNNKFRAVHDYFGHAATGRGFGQDGEESAWVHHSQMFTKNARAALTTETRGQNSFFNNRGKQFADQKVALLPEEFWAVPKVFQKTKVIYFAPGLKPVLKHGEGDQKPHGNWARGVSAEDEALIGQMSNAGPSKEEILNTLVEAESPDSSDLEMLVSENAGLYEQAIEDIDERVDREMSEFGWDDTTKHDADFIENQRNIVYEDNQNKMIQEFIDNDDGTLATMWQEQQGVSLFNPEDFHAAFDDVYSIEHEVTNNVGEVVTVLTSQTTGISNDSGILMIQGDITDSDDNYVGEFQRSFYKETNDNGDEILVVEHDLFRMADEYQGLGFGGKFLAQQEAYYVAKGIDAINVGSAWDGARHWARAGFDFNPKYLERNIQTIVNRVAEMNEFAVGTPARQEFDALMKNTVEFYSVEDNSIVYENLKSMKENNFPIPNDFAMIGYAQREQTGTNDFGKPTYTWAGKKLLDDMNLKYRKILTKEGRTINQGPIDRDGDGLVYDGTAREKPVSAVNSAP